MNNSAFSHGTHALIIGAAGFVGGYLADHLTNECKWSVCVTKMPSERLDIQNVKVCDLDILDKDGISALLDREKPDVIFHLAAQSSVALSWKNPQLTADVNIKGTLNVLDAVRDSKMQPRIVLIGSGEEYGIVRPEEIPVKETTATRPANIYAVTKDTQNALGRLYAKAYGMQIISTRSFNHIGPNQTPVFVVADFCKQVAEIEKGLREPVMYVGNLSAKRDFTDVRDVVRAYSLLAKMGESGETYNVGQGKSYVIRDILDMILSFSDKQIKVETDAARLRPVDVPEIRADISKLVSATGWQPEIALESTISQTLDYWRGRV